jgi:flagellar hook-length control protein FliK
MNSVSLKPQLNMQNPQKDVLSKGLSASSANTAKDSKASFGSVLDEKQKPPSSDSSIKKEKDLSRSTNKNEKLDTRDTREVASKNTSPVNKGEKSEAAAEPDVTQKAQSADEKATEAATREKVMTQFLTRMQSELGIAPEQFVEAFSQLEITDLALPPEETIEKVIANLNLDEGQKLVAEDMYSEMLAMSAAANMSQYLKDNSQGAKLEILTPEQASKKQLQSNINDMSSQFFVNNQPQQPKEVSQIKKAIGYQAYAPKDISSGGFATDMATQMPKLDGAAGAVNPAQVSSNNSGIDLSNLSFEDMPLDPETENAIAALQNKIGEMSLQAPTDAAVPTDLALDKGFVAKEITVNMNTAPLAGAASGEIKALGQAGAADLGFSDSNDSSRGDAEMDPSAFSIDGAQKTGKAGQPQFAIQTPKATTAEVQGNIQEIISQAQFLAKKGGGEMSVQMSPEGMGDLKLKVAVVDGQVSVEMVTANSEAKKLIEKGMSDLKASLASQNLSIDQIRVDSPSETSKHMDQNAGQDSANRQYQQKFLQDFRDNNSGFRREFFDVGTAAVPGSQTSDRASNTVYDPAASKKSSRRLDVVA